eukprot:CAMPEP_0194527424 /NCGR_PEP_ID=MMETSP0253-20130528/63516_1 /TAXON_ID=2966 /ORGANISM="Noctiluca scintillans" /LENGTH=542 /DNA_ID=CAMNT_0039372357 /DNA_START=33 /DNA_END=1658 /DNA_ORIENTATION=+
MPPKYPQMPRMPKIRDAGGKTKDGHHVTSQAAEIAKLQGGSVEHESTIEILRAERAAARSGRKSVQDTVREDQGIDEEDPLIHIDDGIRIEPFNMRREMNEGHFDEAGCYILDKEEEKEVLDAWLDSVDQAQRTSTFQGMDRFNSAKDRVSAISRSLEEGGAPDAEAMPVVTVLEMLISELEPLETPSKALQRWRKGSQAAPPLKLRRQRRQVREAAAATSTSEKLAPASAVVAETSEALHQRKRRKFSEFGYEGTGMPEETDVKDSVPRKMLAEDAPSVVDAEAQTPARCSAGPAAVAAAAQRADAEARAAAEAAAAEASEARLTRQSVHLNADGKEFSEVQAVLAAMAEEPRAQREAATVKGHEMADTEMPVSTSAAAAEQDSSAKKTTRVATPEGRDKIEKLTDLCNELLTHGVLVYDFSREQLVAEVRKRQGEHTEGGGATAGSLQVLEPEQPNATSQEPSPEPAKEIVFVNRRISANEGDQGEVQPAVASDLLWQYRWMVTPGEVHGPFDCVTMQGWAVQGCFGEERPAEVRHCDQA